MRGSKSMRKPDKLALGKCPISRAVSMRRRNTKPEVCLQESQKLNSLTSSESNGTLPKICDENIFCDSQTSVQPPNLAITLLSSCLMKGVPVPSTWI